MKMNEDSQVSIAYEKIKQQIITCYLKPGTQLSDYKLSKEFEMSRAPVREAIILLQRDGLIEINEKSKIVVSSITLNDIVDILHVRSAVECEAILLIADNGWLSDNQIEKLKSILKKTENTDNSIEDVYKLDDLFHHTIIEYSNNPRLLTISDQMSIQMQRARWINSINIDRKNTATSEHGKILKAISEKKLSEALSAIRSHLTKSEKSFREILENEKILNIINVISSVYSSK